MNFSIPDFRVAPQLTVVSAPPRHEAFQRMRGTSTLLGGCPSRGRDRTRQQFPDSPAMIGDASSHRRRLLATCHVQAFMRRAEVRDGADQGHPLLQGQRAARQRPASACQRRQALTERRMQPLARRRVDAPLTLRAPPERLDACWRAIDHAACGLDHPSPLGALDDLGEQDMAPWTPPGPSTRARVHGIAQGLPNGPDGGHQAISTDQQGTMGRTAPHALDQSSDQRHVPLLADFAAQPQAGTDHHRQGHPDHTALFFDPDLIGLHLPQVTRLLDPMLLHRLALVAGTCHPPRHRPLVRAKRHDDRLAWTPVGQQRHHQAHCLRRGPQAIEGRALRGAERLVALRAEKALVLARVDAKVALAGLSSGGARHIGAACRCGVHACVLRVALGNVPRGVCLGPHFHCKRTIPRLSAELPGDLQKVRGKTTLLFKMAEAAVECPEGTVREVLYPVVSEQRLRDLVKEYRASGPTYRHQVYTILRASYSGHYRRMLPPLLEALDFRTTSTAYQPIIMALELLKTHRDSRQQYLMVDGSLPIDGVIPAQWLDLVLEQDAKGLMRVNRMNYEISALHALREALRCKAIWVVGAHRFRNPDEDLPTDFEVRRPQYYAALQQPEHAEDFVAGVQQMMASSLAHFNAGLPRNPKVTLRAQGPNQIKLSPLEPQPEPPNLLGVKAELMRRWPMTSLLDVLKETDL